MISYEATVNGKRVWFKERLARRENRGLMRLIKDAGAEAESDSESDPKQIELLTRIIDRWEFEGNPADPASYEELDELSEIAALKVAVAEHVTARMQGRSADIKN